MISKHRIVLLLVMVTAVLAATVQTATPQEVPVPTRLPYIIEDMERFPGVESSYGEPNRPPDAESVAIIPWSKRAFQSYRDNNWEIYISDDDGFGEARLTIHGASDIHPRLNRGANRLAFASNRTGNYEIYTMNSDGSALTRLTFTGSDNVYPTWSPDGGKILFQSYRDGQPEIYVMNANGSGQTRLTASTGFDGYPSWSPDGTKIAFSSSRSGQAYSIYTMNADGSGVIRLSNQNYSFNPAWSPDGARIAYDADGDNNGWQELWVMDANGANQQMLYNPDELTDAWARSWSPDGRYIAYTLISFVYYQNNWYWQHAYLDAFDTTISWPTRLSNSGLDWYPDWQTVDDKPPISSVAPLPLGAQPPGFRVEWSGSDIGSGLASYDIQYRVGTDGAWQNWQTAVTDTSAPFSATSGTTVFFRSRARDLAYNTEAWPTAPDASTTFYSWPLWGNVIDNRGQPLSGVVATINPNPVINEATDSRGNFRNLLLANSAHTLDIQRTGYEDLVATTLNQDVVRHIYLPPANNQVLNGDFEAAPILNHWQTSGSLPITNTPIRHTGSQAALLGTLTCTYPCLTSGEASPVQEIELSDMVVDSLGTVHILWKSDVNAMYTTRTITGTWETQSLHHSWFSDFGLSVTLDDRVHMLLLDGGLNVKYTHKPTAGNWSPWQTVATLPATIYEPKAFVHKLVADSQGQLHALITVQNTHQGQTAFYLRQLSDSSWSFAEMRHHNLIMGLGPDDTVHFAWSPLTHYPENDSMFYQSQLATGNWSNIVEVPLVAMHRLDLESLEVAPNGTVHILGMVTEGLYDTPSPYHFMRTPDATWSNSLIHAGQTYSTSDYYFTKNELAVDSQGVVHFALWDNDFSALKAIYRQWQPGTGWQPELILASDVWAAPLLVVDQFDLLHILLQENFLVTYRRSLPASSSGTAELAQTFMIPVDMPAPTLAFMGRRFGDVAGNASGAQLLVTVGMTTTAVTLPSGNAAWTHYWFDMSHWSGQTVTVQFKLNQAMGEPRVAFVVDDVSLGSSYPNIWVTGIGSNSQTARPGDNVMYLLHYGNLGGVMAQDVVMTATLPAGLSFESASIPATEVGQVLTWNLGDLPAASSSQVITLTAAVAANAPALNYVTTQLAVSSATPELEMDNNVASITTFIGYRSYLPFIVR